MTPSSDPSDDIEIIASGRFLRLVQRGGWEFVERSNAVGVVVIVAVTDEGELVLTEQFRKPVGKTVIDLPAGLAGDIVGEEGEAFEIAARRELLEETGFEATKMRYLSEGPSSAGMSSEIVTFFRAEGLRKVAEGGGDDTEDITVHLVSIDQIDAWLAARMDEGMAIDPKLFAGLYFASRQYDD